MCFTYCNSGWNALGEENALALNDEEVYELLQVVKGAFYGLLWDLVVFPRADRGRKAEACDEPSSNLCE